MNIMELSFWSVIPPLLTIFLVLKTRKILLSMAIGITLGCFIIGKFRFFQAGAWLGALSSFSCAVGTAGTWPSRAGPYFFEEIGERTPRGRRFLPLGTPFSGGRNGGRWFRQVGAWPAASKTNASWPAHRLGRAGEVVY